MRRPGRQRPAASRSWDHSRVDSVAPADSLAAGAGIEAEAAADDGHPQGSEDSHVTRDDLSNRVQSPRSQQDAHRPDDARDDHRRVGGDHARRHGKRRPIGHRGSNQGRRHQHDHGQRRQLLVGWCPDGLGRVEHADSRRRPRGPRRVRRAICGGRDLDAHAGRRGQPELVHPRTGNRYRPAAHPRVDDEDRMRFSAPRT